MKFSKCLTNPVLVIFTAAAFLFLVTGCERTVTMYDKDGKPYSAKEPDPWGTIAGIILTGLVIGAIAVAADSNSGSCLPNQHETMLAYAGNKGIVYDVSPGMYSSVKCFRIMDADGNLISEHLIDVDKLLASKSLVNLSDVQLSSAVNMRMLRKLAREVAKANNLSTLPNAVKTDISYLADAENTLKVNRISIPVVDGKKSNASELTLMSEKGIFKISTSLHEKSNSESEQLSITVSKLN